MKKALLMLVAIAAMPVAGVIAAQAQTPPTGPHLAPPLPGQPPQTQSSEAQPSAGPKRPASVPPNYRITPFGYFDPSCVVHLAQGDEMLMNPAQRGIRNADGTISPMPACSHPHYRGDGQKVDQDEQGVQDPNISHSWIVSESVTAKVSYGFLSAEWSVPPTPASNDGQTLFYFPGLEDSNDVVTIIQPVLGWNSDYASAWGIASWNCCISGTTYEATPQKVNPGDTILGYMYETCGWGVRACSTWDIVTWDLQNGNFSELALTSSFGQTFNWAFAGVLEVYNIAKCSDYPNNPNGFTGGTHDISFNEIGLYNFQGTSINPTWVRTLWDTGGTPQCSYNGAVARDILLQD